MKKHNIFASALLVVCLLLAPSCGKDLLEEKVISRISNDYINTPKGFTDAVSAAYSTMRTWYGTERGMTMTVFGTDTYTNGADGSWKFFNQYTSQLDPRAGFLSELWRDFYRGINTCNAVIDRAPNVTGITDVLRKQRVAEAKFIRAHHYFILVQTFGALDLRLSETLTPTIKVTRTPEADVYKQIVKDLEEAIPDLEAKARSVQYGRATRPAAEHLLARVYLTKATSSGKAADDYDKAAALANKVIKDYGIKLLPDFAKVFDEGSGEINDEVIWSVQYTKDPLTNQQANPTGAEVFNTGNNAHVFFIMEYDVQAGMARDIVNGRPFKRFRPTNYTYNTIFKDRINDTRYDKTFKVLFRSNRPGSFSVPVNDGTTATKPGTFALGDTAIWLPGVEVPKTWLTSRPYQIVPPSAYSERLFPTLSKFLDTQRPDRTTFEGSRDYLAFRLGETYLILAEALIKTGKPNEAADAINAVRTRAAASGKTDAMKITPEQATMDFLMEERERELIGEQLRWFDLKRWGNLVERVKLYNPQAAPAIRDIHVLRPIPQDQIDRSEDGVRNFPQNPGY